jgi:hypothetical protein
MSEFRVATLVDARLIRRRNRLSLWKLLHAGCVGIVAVLVLALALISAPPNAVRADDPPQSGANLQVPDAANQSAFAAGIRRTFQNQYNRMIKLANELIENPDSPRTREDPTQALPGRRVSRRVDDLDQLGNLEDQLAIQKTRLEAAKANLLRSQLSRELAELALTEYEQATFVQEKAALDEEIRIFKDELEKARAHVPVAKDQLARIMLTSQRSSSDLANEFDYTSEALAAELGEMKAKLVLEQTESKLKVFLEYTKPFRTSNLGSDVERAKSDEHAKHATLALEKFKLTKLERLIKARDLPSAQRDSRNVHDRHALALLDRTIPIEERLRTKIEQLTEAVKLDQPLRKEIQDLSDQLQALVDQAEIDHSSAQFDKLKRRSQ